MSDPRVVGRVEDPNAVFKTYTADNSAITYSATAAGGSSKVDLAVTLNSSGTVETAADGEFVLGKLIRVEPAPSGTAPQCVVQVDGYCTLPGGNGASLTRGKAIVGALNASGEEGYIREVATGTAAELGRQRGFIDDPSTTTAVVVKL